jgi:hypothetical protein
VVLIGCDCLSLGVGAAGCGGISWWFGVGWDDVWGCIIGPCTLGLGVDMVVGMVHWCGMGVC